MNEISGETEKIFYKAYFDEDYILEFEKWIYGSTELEKKLNSNSYFEFLSFKYEQNNAFFELKKLIESEITKGQIEKWRITKDLLNAKNRNEDYPKSIRNFFWMYCDGYKFLDCLAFPYGLHADQTFMYFETDKFDELPKTKKQEFIVNCYPNIINEIDKVLNWLENKEIILTGEINTNGKLEYINNRIDLENDNLNSDEVEVKKTKWWQFWK
tara:strand:- start:604 stop:1242 length:639 start_codon:yes stop_codon:yes gene_type:complete